MVHLRRQAVGAMLQVGQLVRGARVLPLDPPERRDREEQQAEEHLGGAAELVGLARDLHRDTDGGAGAPRRGGGGGGGAGAARGGGPRGCAAGAAARPPPGLAAAASPAEGDR